MITRGEPPEHYLHPDQRDEKGHKLMVDLVTEYVKKHLPGIEPTPCILEPAVYTVSVVHTDCPMNTICLVYTNNLINTVCLE